MQDGAPQSDFTSPALSTQKARSEARRSTMALREAEVLFLTGPDWMTFFRQILGVEGIVRQLFPSVDQLARFEQSAEFDQIQMMLAELRVRKVPPALEEPVKMITVRLPASLHEALRAEAYDRRTSLNKLCIAKLLQVVEGQRAEPEDVTSETGTSRSSPRNR